MCHSHVADRRSLYVVGVRITQPMREYFKRLWPWLPSFVTPHITSTPKRRAPTQERGSTSRGMGESFSISQAYRASQTNKSGIPAGPTVSIDQTVLIKRYPRPIIKLMPPIQKRLLFRLCWCATNSESCFCRRSSRASISFCVMIFFSTTSIGEA